MQNSEGSSSNTGTSFLPRQWNEDEIMTGMMAMIKARNVNPIDYDRKVRFWSDAISDLCEYENIAVFDMNHLKQKFRRGDNVPAGLATVLENMKEKGEVISLDEWREKRSSWFGWGATKIVKTGSWLWGKNSETPIERMRLIHMPTVKKQAKALMDLYANEYEPEMDSTKEIIAYSDFYTRAKHVVRTLENFDIILEEMIECGDVTVGLSKSGEKILKFRDIGSDGPVHFTEADASVHDIRRAMAKIEKDVTVLEKKVKKLDEDCRKALRSGEKQRAASFLRQKKRVEKDISDKDGQLQGLLGMLHQLQSTKLNREVLDAYRIGNEAFKANMSKHGLTPSKVETTMDEIHSSIDEYKEIEEAMANGFGLRQTNTDDLEKELSELLQDEKKAAGEIQMPDVPRKTLGLVDEVDDVALERRLRALRD